MKLINFVLLAAFYLWLAGCAAFTAYGRLEKQARQAYQRGDYDQAVYDCAYALRINPSYEPAQFLIQDTFKAAVIEHKANLNNLSSSTEKFRWDKIVSEYNDLIRLNRTIDQLPVLRHKATGELIAFETTDYSSQMAPAIQMAAEIHYNEGITLSSSNDLKIKKQAAKEFKMALGFVAGYRDASQKYEEMRQAAILRMAMMPFEDKTGTRRKYGSVSEVIMDDVVSSILSDNSATEFLELVSRERLEEVIEEQALSQSGIIDESMAIEVGKILGVNEILSGKITQIIVSPEETTRDVRREKSKVVIRREKYVDDEGKEKVRKIYGEVEAKIIVFKRSTSARIRGSYNIVDVETARILKSDSFEESSSANVSWATFSGDERAISWSTRQLAKKGEQRVPVEGEMVNMAAKKISTSLAKSIKDYAR